MDKVTLQSVSFLDGDCCESNIVLLNGKRIWYSHDLAVDCPEDATLSRDMTNGGQIVELMNMVSGKEIEVLPQIHCETEEEFRTLENSR